MNVYITPRFYLALGLCVIFFLFAYSYSWMYNLTLGMLMGLSIVVLVEYFLLRHAAKALDVKRIIHDQLSLGDEQHIRYHKDYTGKRTLDFEMTDELPYQLQHRSYIERGTLTGDTDNKIKYKIRPTLRGLYEFGHLHTYISNPIPGFIQRKVTTDQPKTVAVYPSIIQMRKYEMQVFSKTATMTGLRRVRQIGENDEFEHIRNYAQGDNIRSINWKATSRQNELMVNTYENSKAQMVYMIVDKGRSMKMPFHDMTLLDHAINTTLVISNIILKKYDRAGLVTFSDKIGVALKAEANSNQLQKITKYLFDQKTSFNESNFELLFYTLRSHISRRSILLFFTNFEHHYDMKRNLKYLRSLNNKHLLVVILFINTELEQAQYKETEVMKDIYFKSFAQKAIIEKEKIANELRANGIQVILTKPEDLAINTINKYLEIKAKRMR